MFIIWDHYGNGATNSQRKYPQAHSSTLLHATQSQQPSICCSTAMPDRPVKRIEFARWIILKRQRQEKWTRVKWSPSFAIRLSCDTFIVLNWNKNQTKTNTLFSYFAVNDALWSVRVFVVSCGREELALCMPNNSHRLCGTDTHKQTGVAIRRAVKPLNVIIFIANTKVKSKCPAKYTLISCAHYVSLFVVLFPG